ncbi:MAG TPA: hypothetical protein DCL48_15565, partial [Alphaproteobacteria bacterium]|nr:hypothetical protein [Alphaproteobacteria bacterium]
MTTKPKVAKKAAKAQKTPGLDNPAAETQAAPDNTGQKRGGTPPVEHQFKPGNPGRPKGARNKLGEAFLSDM